MAALVVTMTMIVIVIAAVIMVVIGIAATMVVSMSDVVSATALSIALIALVLVVAVLGIRCERGRTEIERRSPSGPSHRDHEQRGQSSGPPIKCSIFDAHALLQVSNSVVQAPRNEISLKRCD